MSLASWQVGLLVGGLLLLLLVLSAVIGVACMIFVRRRNDETTEDDERLSEEGTVLPNGGHALARDDVMAVGAASSGSPTEMMTPLVAQDRETDEQASSSLLAGNPLYNPQEYLYNFDNPTYDTEHGSRYDASVKIQSTYRGYRARQKWSEVRTAVLVIQKWVRGFLARRRVYKYKVSKRKHQQAKLQSAANIKLKRQNSSRVGLLKGLALFDVKALGSVEVSKLHGEETVKDALGRMKKEYGVKGKSRMKISVSPHGLKLFDAASMTQLAHIRITSVSYCSVDSKTNKVFAFIHNLGNKGSKGICYGFHCINNDADKLAKTVAEAYHLVFKRLQKVREKRQQQKMASLMASRAAEEAKRLEEDLDVHLDELENDFAELAQLMTKGSVSNLVNVSNFGEAADDVLAASSSHFSLDSLDGGNVNRSRYTGSQSTLDDLDDEFPDQQLGEAVDFSDLQDAFTKFEMAGLPAFDNAIEQFLQGDTSALDYAQQRELGIEIPRVSGEL